MRILVTGGAGFIGCYTVSLLVAAGHDVVVLDTLQPPAHPLPHPHPVPRELVVVGDVNDPDVYGQIGPVDCVIHLAAHVSVAKGQYEVASFVRSNVHGTAVLMEAVRTVLQAKHVVYASSMSIYGDGHQHVGIDEQWPLNPVSIYGETKLAAERICMLAAEQFGISCTALRLWNTYGAGQSLTNSETGAVPIFTHMIQCGDPPRIFEDGRQLRDFVHVRDVARAFMLAAEQGRHCVLNIGTGRPTPVIDVARALARSFTGHDRLEIVERRRPGDARHCWPNINLARQVLGWEPTIDLGEGLNDWCEWARRATAGNPRVSAE